MKLYGTIKDENGLPLEGVEVRITFPDHSEDSVFITPQNGGYGLFYFDSFNVVGTKLYLSKPGYQNFDIGLDTLFSDYFVDESDNNPVNEFNFVLTKKSGALLPILLGSGLLIIAANNEKKKVGAVEKTDILNIGLVIGGGFLLFKGINILNSLFDFLGLSKSKETQSLDFSSSDPNSFWNPNFWRQFSSFTYAITEPQAQQIINQLKDAFGYFNDDESAAISALKTLRTQSNLSFLAWEFSKTDNQDLLTWLRGDSFPNDRLSDSEVYSLHQYFSNLPSH